MYSEKVMEHFRNPRNVGEIDKADGVGEVGNPVCGDMMTFYVKIDNGILTDVKFKTFGCGAAIAVSSMVSEMAKGKTVDEAMKISNADVAKELGGLPPNKLHCSNLGADALHKAIEDYLARKNEGEKEGCRCPYCDEPVAPPGVPCVPCNVKIRYCPACGKPLPKDSEECPECSGHDAAGREAAHQ
ncbi:Fe-S cluster assembly scaffold protein NifU [candidate division WOR-3 bacterium]|nr:Fe-S cluster assembly scaffold protein NifU [candidate division WOR-3 bacterium]